VSVGKGTAIWGLFGQGCQMHGPWQGGCWGKMRGLHIHACVLFLVTGSLHGPMSSGSLVGWLSALQMNSDHFTAV
jgi:hypothetical protein